MPTVAVPVEYRELHQSFSRGPAILREALTDLSMGELTRRAGGEGWSTRDVLVHLADMELVRGFRIRLILADDNPLLVNVDEGAWQRRLHYLWRSPEAAIAQFEQLRFGTAEILNQCGRDAWQRAGVHVEDGEVSVADLVRRGVAHVEDHVRQIAEIRASRRT
jgi:hypothetical protein